MVRALCLAIYTCAGTDIICSLAWGTSAVSLVLTFQLTLHIVNILFTEKCKQTIDFTELYSKITRIQ